MMFTPPTRVLIITEKGLIDRSRGLNYLNKGVLMYIIVAGDYFIAMSGGMLKCHNNGVNSSQKRIKILQQEG